MKPILHVCTAVRIDYVNVLQVQKKEKSKHCFSAKPEGNNYLREK